MKTERGVEQLVPEDFPGIDTEKFETWQECAVARGRVSGFVVSLLVVASAMLWLSGVTGLPFALRLLLGFATTALISIVVVVLLGRRPKQLAAGAGLSPAQIRQALAKPYPQQHTHGSEWAARWAGTATPDDPGSPGKQKCSPA